MEQAFVLVLLPHRDTLDGLDVHFLVATTVKELTRTQCVIYLYCTSLHCSCKQTDCPSQRCHPTCSVLMQDLMSLSVFSHSDIRVPVSAFIPCRSEICKEKLNVNTDCLCVRMCLCAVCVSWPLPVSVRGGKAESGGKSGGRPAAWEVGELEHNWKERKVIRQYLAIDYIREIYNLQFDAAAKHHSRSLTGRYRCRWLVEAGWTPSSFSSSQSHPPPRRVRLSCSELLTECWLRPVERHRWRNKIYE